MPHGGLPVTIGWLIIPIIIGCLFVSIMHSLRMIGTALPCLPPQRTSRPSALRNNSNAIGCAGAMARSQHRSDAVGKYPFCRQPRPGLKRSSTKASDRDLGSYSAFFRKRPPCADWIGSLAPSARVFTVFSLCSCHRFVYRVVGRRCRTARVHGLYYEDACRGISCAASEGRMTIEVARDRLTALGVQFVDSASM